MQLPREPLLTAEMQHLLAEHRGAFHDGWAWQGTRSAEGSSVGGKLRACPILGLHKMSPSLQRLVSCFICPSISSPATSQGWQKLCISCYSPAVWHLCLCYHHHWICSCQTANHRTHCTCVCPGVSRLPAEQQPLALDREDRTAGTFLHSHAPFSVKLQPYKAASHKEDTAQDLSR